MMHSWYGLMARIIQLGPFISSLLSRVKTWGYVNGTLSPSNKDKEKDQYAKWEIEDAQVQSRILGSVEPHIILNLRTYQIATNMWTYLKKHYSQNHIARRFQLEFELSNLT